MSKFSKLIEKIIGVKTDLTYDTNFEGLISEGWISIEDWHGLKLYQKEDERIIYNPNNDEIVRRFLIQK